MFGTCMATLQVVSAEAEREKDREAIIEALKRSLNARHGYQSRPDLSEVDK